MNKKAILLGGGSGAGKSTMLESLELDLSEFVRIDSDKLLEQLPEYQEQIRLGNKDAAAMFYEKASRLADELLENCIAESKSFILDGTLKTPEKAVALVKRLLEEGYAAETMFVMAPIKNCVDRCVDRGQQTGRFVPVDVIKSAHIGARRTMRVFRRIGFNHKVFFNK